MRNTHKGSIKTLTAALVMASSLSLPALAQGGRDKPARGAAPAHAPARAPERAPARPEVGGGHIPARGPAKARPREAPAAPARQPAPNYAHAAGHPDAPHVDARNDTWVGHDTRVREAGLRLEHPWAHGHFGGVLGATHVYRLGGGDYRRFGFDGAFFSVAAVDCGYAGDWLWDSDDIVLYADPNDIGYYLAYNVRLGTYVHVEYIGE